MRLARRGVESTLHTDTRYIRDYVSRMSPADKTISPEGRSFPGRSFYGRRNNSVVISRGFEKTRPSAGDFLEPGVIPVCFISETVDSRKLSTEWDVTFSRYATWATNNINCRPDSSQVIGRGVKFLAFKLTDWKTMIHYIFW